MPKNKIGGSKHKKAKNFVQNTSIRYKENDEQYGKVVKILGNCRFNVLCSDGLERLSIMRGKFKKRKYINLHDIVLLEVWDFQDSKASIIDVYTDDNVKKLMKTLDFPKIFVESEQIYDNDYCNFDIMGYDSNCEDKEEDKEIDLNEDKEEDKEIDLNEDKEEGEEIDLDEI